MGKNVKSSKAASSKTKSSTKKIAKKTLKVSQSSPKKASKAKSAFTRTVTLFKDLKDNFSIDEKYNTL